MFTKEAQDIIKQYLCFILKENDDDESGYVNADDINDDQMLIAAPDGDAEDSDEEDSAKL